MIVVESSMLLFKASVCRDNTDGKERADIHACCALLGQCRGVEGRVKHLFVLQEVTFLSKIWRNDFCLQTLGRTLCFFVTLARFESIKPHRIYSSQ